MSFAKKKGELSWPVSGRVTQKFGRIRAGSKLKWRGVLIETQAGAVVSAVEKGQVVFADWLTGYGFVLIIEHGKGYMSLYAHNQQLLGKVGDQVRKNQHIALAGNSGRSGKPALYFEIRYKGKPVNPARWIVARKPN
ncbi:MAG: peptidoglycan DD-metalloendopeptidase family protein [Gammaproteobacteria bacterium]|nr:peptidoglycan DD-metalloendopeptidase family protein [Gammaproteobacteria bacterium]